MKNRHRTFIAPSSVYSPTRDCLLVFQVARVAESHEQPDLSWVTALMALGEDG